MPTNANSVDDYLNALPPERRTALSAVREVILANLPAGYEEKMQYGMIGYVVPHTLYPAGYHCKPSDPLPCAMLCSQKGHMALHLMTVYLDPKTAQWFRKAYTSTGKKLDMGKACIRFKKLEDLPLKVIGQAIARVPVKTYVAQIEQVLSSRKSSRTRKQR